MRAGFDFRARIFITSWVAATAFEISYQADLFAFVVDIEGETTMAHQFQQ